jgi:hypothetical protein
MVQDRFIPEGCVSRSDMHDAENSMVSYSIFTVVANSFPRPFHDVSSPSFLQNQHTLPSTERGFFFRLSISASSEAMSRKRLAQQPAQVDASR